jgi:Uri superfamily endonuclease
LSARWVDDAGDLPAEAGAYILFLELNEPARLPPRRFVGLLPAGRYLYFGSARGPGGIRGRCVRHFRRAKKTHWHVDWLTTSAARLIAAAFPGLGECDLVARTLAAGGAAVEVAVAGFGSTDCRRCAAHLLALRGEPGVGFFDDLYQ